MTDNGHIDTGPANNAVYGCGCLLYIVIGLFTAWHSYDFLTHWGVPQTVGGWFMVKCFQCLLGMVWPLYWLGELFSVRL